MAQPPYNEKCDVSIAFSNNELGVHINVMQRTADGTMHVLYAGRVPGGDSYTAFNLFPSNPPAQKKEESIEIKRAQYDAHSRWLAGERRMHSRDEHFINQAHCRCPSPLLGPDWRCLVHPLDHMLHKLEVYRDDKWVVVDKATYDSAAHDDRRVVEAYTAKPFVGPGVWFPINLLGSPMREHAPGRWESAKWPSDQSTDKE